jgi:hypothetical protein
MKRTKKNSLTAMKLNPIFLSITITLSGCYETTEKTVYLEQGWNAQNQYREISYNLSQGSNLIPYDWYLALEIPVINMPLNSKEVAETLRYLSTDTASERNPDKLPVGFVKNIDADNKEWIGLTCAACHTSQINYNGTGIRIDGGPAMGDFITLLKLIKRSIGDTLVKERKFRRFAYKLYGQDWLVQAEALKLDMEAMKQKVADIIVRNDSIVKSGYGRVDAFGSIGNEVFVDDLGIPANFSQAKAPADYPFLWDTPILERVQWVGNVENPFGRNIGEVFGVFGEVNLTDRAHLFSSSVKYKNIFELEEMLRSLKSPKWPESMLVKINRVKASRGEMIYKTPDAYGYTCVSCHSLPDSNGQYPLTPAEDNLFGKQFIKTYNIPLDEIGTDPNTANEIFEPPLVDVGPILASIFGQQFLPRTFAQSAVVGLTLRKALDEIDPPLSDYEKAAYSGFRFYTPGKEPAADFTGYKARPLNGIWATAPYLHNGSVRTLSMLLTEPALRETRFWKGTREFDPVNVGFKSRKSAAAQLFNATEPGNLNSGHDYGTSFNKREKSDLIEFLKTL